MIGYTRLALALIVMATHLTGALMIPAALAVLAFYGLAGYLATASMQGPYKGRPWAFLVSRWLRLWPTYAVVFVLSLGWLLAIGAGWQSLGLTADWRLLPQVLGIVWAGGDPRIVPVGWVLRWFVLLYAVVALGGGKTPQRVALWLTLALLWQQAELYHFGFPGAYYSPSAALLCGAVGASAYWAGVVLPRDGRWAALAGALSYPLFLCHYLIGAIVAARDIPVGWALLRESFAPALALSLLLVLLVEKPIARYRSRLKG